MECLYRTGFESATEADKGYYVGKERSRAKRREAGLKTMRIPEVRQGYGNHSQIFQNYSRAVDTQEFKDIIKIDGKIGTGPLRVSMPAIVPASGAGTLIAAYVAHRTETTYGGDSDSFYANERPPVFLDVESWIAGERNPHTATFFPQPQASSAWALPVSVILVKGLIENFSTLTPIRFAALCRHYAAVTKTVYRTNGSPEGAMNRLKACWKVAVDCGYGKPEHDLRSLLGSQLQEKVKAKLGFCPCPVLSAWTAEGLLAELPAKYPELLRVNRTAAAGMPHNPTIKRDQTICGDLDFLERVLNELKLDEFADEMVRTHQICDTIEDNFVVWLKPKLEVVSKDKHKGALAMSRNIMVTPSFVTTLISMFMQDALRGSKHIPLFNYFGDTNLKVNIHQATETSSLAGFNPYNGGMEFVLRVLRIRASVSGVFRCTYSDNLFAMIHRDGSYVLESWDGDKMESSAKPNDARDSIDFLVEQMRTVAPVSRQVHALLKTLGANTAVNNKFVVANVHGEFPGLGSGAQTTFWVNHYRMNAVLALIEDSGEVDTGKALASISYKPVSVRPVATSGDDIGYPTYATAEEGDISEMNVTICNLDELFDPSYAHVGRVDKYGAICRLDLLGFDATSVIVNGRLYIAPLLNYKRCYQAFIFLRMKHGDKTEESKGPTYENIKSLTILTQLYYIGGYNYPDLTELMRTCAAELVNSLVAFALGLNHHVDYVGNPDEGLEIIGRLENQLNTAGSDVLMDDEFGLAANATATKEETDDQIAAIMVAIRQFFTMRPEEVLNRRRAFEYGILPRRETFQRAFAKKLLNLHDPYVNNDRGQRGKERKPLESSDDDDSESSLESASEGQLEVASEDETSNDEEDEESVSARSASESGSDVYERPPVGPSVTARPRARSPRPSENDQPRRAQPSAEVDRIIAMM